MLPVGAEIWVRHRPSENLAAPSGGHEQLGISWEILGNQFQASLQTHWIRICIWKRCPSEKETGNSSTKWQRKSICITPPLLFSYFYSSVISTHWTDCSYLWIGSQQQVLKMGLVKWKAPWNQPLGIRASPARDLVLLVGHRAVYLWL